MGDDGGYSYWQLSKLLEAAAVRLQEVTVERDRLREALDKAMEQEEE